MRKTLLLRLIRNPSTKLRKQNRIKTFHSSLEIEGNTLSEEQTTALLENKIVISPKKDVVERYKNKTDSELESILENRKLF